MHYEPILELAKGYSEIYACTNSSHCNYVLQKDNKNNFLYNLDCRQVNEVFKLFEKYYPLEKIGLSGKYLLVGTPRGKYFL